MRGGLMQAIVVLSSCIGVARSSWLKMLRNTEHSRTSDVHSDAVNSSVALATVLFASIPGGHRVPLRLATCNRRCVAMRNGFPSQGKLVKNARVKRRTFLKSLARGLCAGGIAVAGAGKAAAFDESDDVVDRFKEIQEGLNDFQESFVDVRQRLNEIIAEDSNRTIIDGVENGGTVVEASSPIVNFVAGDLVRTVVSMQSDGVTEAQILKDTMGRISRIDQDGDALVQFQGIDGGLWISKNKFQLLIKMPESEAVEDTTAVEVSNAGARMALERSKEQAGDLQEDVVKLRNERNLIASMLKESEAKLATELKTESSLEAKLEQQEMDVRSLEAALKEARSKAAKDRNAVEASIAEEKDALQATATQANALREEARALKSERDSIAAALKSSETQLATELKTEKSLEAKLAQQEREVSSLASLLKEADSKAAKDRVALEASIKEARTASERSNAQASATQEARALMSERNSIAATLKEAEEKLASELKTKSSLEAKLAQQERDVSSLASLLKERESKASQDRSAVEVSVAEARIALETSKAQANKLQEDALGLKSERDSIAAALKNAEEKLAFELKTKASLEAKLAQQEKDGSALASSLGMSESKVTADRIASGTSVSANTQQLLAPSVGWSWRDIVAATAIFLAVRMNFRTQLELVAVENKLADRQTKAKNLLHEFDSLRNVAAHTQAQKHLHVSLPEASLLDVVSKNASTPRKTRHNTKPVFGSHEIRSSIPELDSLA